MKKLLWVFFLIFTLSMNPQFAVAQSENPIEQLTGTVWLDLESDVKKALLYGVNIAIAIEHSVEIKMAEKKAAMAQKGEEMKEISYLSPFEKGWYKAFQGVPSTDLVETIDAWYIANPDQKNRPVFDVIWFELIAPKLK